MIELSGRVIYLDLALVFLLLRFSLRTLFFLHLALILACKKDELVNCSKAS